MNISASKTTKLLTKAARVFSQGQIDTLTDQGLDFFETKAQGAYFTDDKGNKMLDCHSGSAMFNLGRNHPEIARALVQANKETDQGNFVAVSEEKALAAERLSRFMPSPLSCFLFAVVRGEAMDAACKLARGKTGKTRLISVDGAYYGDTGFALSLSDVAGKEDFGSLIPDVEIIGFNDTGALEQIDDACAAVVIELFQTETGGQTADPEWVRLLRRQCDRTDTLLIIDETQTGFGRTGKKFMFENYHIVPDILVFGEAVTGGMFPMTGMAFTPEVKTFFDAHPLIHLCTFGGHDVGCRTAVSAIEIYDREKPWENARLQGERILEALSPAIADSPETESITGSGLLIALRFKTTVQAEAFCARAGQENVFVVNARFSREVVLIRPPLTLTDNETDQLILGLRAVLGNNA